MNVQDALYHAVHDYPGGCAALAPRLGKAPSTLQNMADPRQDTHQWSLRAVRGVLQFTNDMRPLHALCEENGGVFVPTARLANSSLPDLYHGLAKLAKEFGDVPREVEAAMGDNKISPHEAVNIQKQLMELIEQAAAFSRRIDIEAAPKNLRAVS